MTRGSAVLDVKEPAPSGPAPCGAGLEGSRGGARATGSMGMVSGRAGGRLARGIFRRLNLVSHKAAKGLLPGRLRTPSGRPAPCPDTRDASRSASLVGRGWATI